MVRKCKIRNARAQVDDVYLWCSVVCHHFTLNPLTACQSVCSTMQASLHPTEWIPFNSLQGISTLLEPLPSSVLPHSQPTYECHYNPHHTAAAGSRPSLCLPHGIRIVNMGPPDQSTIISCRASISKGTRFGPYRGRVVQPSQVKEGEDNEFLWEVSIVKPLMATVYTR